MANKKNLSRREYAAQRDAKKVEAEEKSFFSALSNNSIAIDVMEAFLSKYTTDQSLLDLAQKNATVSTCIDLIATIIATTPLNLYRIQKDGTFKPVKGKRHIDNIFSKPNDSDTGFSYKYKMASFLLATGNIYLVRHKDESFVVPSTHCTKASDGKSFNVRIDNDTLTLPKDKVLQVFKPSLNFFANNLNVPKYNSPLFHALKETLLNDEIIRHATRHIKSGMMSKGALKISDDSNSSMSQTQMAQLAKQFTEATSGDKSTNTVILPKGLTYETFNQTASDSQAIEFSELTNKLIIRAFKIPESMFNSENGGSYATANIQEITFYKNTVKPMCLMIEEFINQSDIFTSDTEYYKFELGDLVSAEELQIKATTANVKANTAAVLNSIRKMTDNEIRDAAGFEHAVDSQENEIVEANISPLEQGFEVEEDEEGQFQLDKSSIFTNVDVREMITSRGEKDK